MHKVNVGAMKFENTTIEVEIVGQRVLSARVWLARQLIALAAFILGSNVEFK